MAAFGLRLKEIVAGNRPCTVRQVYYIAVSQGLVAKDTGSKRSSYTRVIKSLGSMRENGLMPFEWLSDSTRWRRHVDLWSCADAAVTDMARYYRRDLWARQPQHLEVWVESDSIAGMLTSVTYDLGVALMPCRGQSSKTFAYSAAKEYENTGRPVTVLYVGDFDPSGLRISQSLEERLRRYAPLVELEFRRIAVNAQQIITMNLSGHVPNRADTSFHAFEAHCNAYRLPVEAVETEAMPPAVLRDLVRGAVERYIEPDAWSLELRVEAEERKGLQTLAAGGWTA